MSRIVLGVAGGIAAYKSCELTRRFTEAGHEVTVVPTAAALNFVGAATFEALSGRPVHTDVFTDVAQVPHVQLGQQADLVMIAPATADLLARAASGRADDLLTNVLLTARCPVIFAPAMHTEMWSHPATADNVATLRRRGCVVIDPDSGRLTGQDSGPGRLPDPAELYAIAGSVLDRPETAARAADQDLAGLRVTISAGGTREHLDPVRFLGNSSSGLTGWALARAARLRGAQVQLVAANVQLPPPAGCAVETITSTEDLHHAMTKHAAESDLVVMAAAAADFTPAASSDTKIKKQSESDGLSVELIQTTDVLAALVRDRTDPRQVLVGFAAETPTAEHSLLELGRAKLARKGCDLLVLNAVGKGLAFGQPDNEITIIAAEGTAPSPVQKERSLSQPKGAAVSLSKGPIQGSKDTLAHEIWDVTQTVRSER